MQMCCEIHIQREVLQKYIISSLGIGGTKRILVKGKYFKHDVISPHICRTSRVFSRNLFW